MEPSVTKTLEKAGGIQRGKNAKALRSTGRYDLVIGHQDMRPRSVIEVKSPMWHPMQKSMVSDLQRLCKTLLQNKNGTQILSALLAMYVSSKQPHRKDETAEARLKRKWQIQMPRDLMACDWAGHNKKRFLNNLNFQTHTHISPYTAADGLHAWGSVCIAITRKTPAQRKKTKVNSSTRVRRLGTEATSSDV